MCVPGRNTGTTKVAINDDPEPNATVVRGTVMLSMVKDAKPWIALFAKPEPTTVTVVPTAAEEGLTMVSAGAPVFVKVAAPLIPVVVIVCGPPPDVGTVKEPTVVGGVGQVFAATCVAPAIAAPSKFMAVVVAGVVRNPVTATVVP